MEQETTRLYSSAPLIKRNDLQQILEKKLLDCQSTISSRINDVRSFTF